MFVLADKTVWAGELFFSGMSISLAGAEDGKCRNGMVGGARIEVMK
ncbi:MAG TPA: hypothetical protein VLJ11_14345 [Bryobacteraceae bacterium]|nr:hypothetical protein [Bryobacteraceae bacterium]